MSITISHSVFVKGKKYLWCLEQFSPFALLFHECYSSYHGHSNIAIWWKISQRKNHIIKNLLQMFSYIILHTGCLSIKLQTYDHSISACWVWGWLRVKRVVETALLLLYTPLKNPPSKILTKAISIWGTSRYLVSKGGGGTHGFYGGERRPVPIKNVFNGSICTSVRMLHLTTHNCFIFFFFLIYNPF